MRAENKLFSVGVFVLVEIDLVLYAGQNHCVLVRESKLTCF